MRSSTNCSGNLDLVAAVGERNDSAYAIGPAFTWGLTAPGKQKRKHNAGLKT